MATGTAGNTAFRNAKQTVSFFRKRIVFSDGAAQTHTLGILRAGAMILGPISGVQVITAFNAVTTNLLDIGITGTLERFASDLALGTVAFVPIDVTTALRVMAVDTPIIATVAMSGTAATTGEAEIVIAFICDNDN
jgi:hypothetical protein